MLIGNLSLALALPLSIYCILISFFGAKSSILCKKARTATHLVTLLVSIASIMLIFAFITNSFNIEYVYSYSGLSLPLVYKLSGIWAGLDGSLLFWLWLMAIFGTIVAFKKRDNHLPYINAVVQCVVAFFLIMLVFEANPFKETSFMPPDGRGLNPLLQNVFMLFHPPMLYLGYVGFAVPFAYAIAALILRKRGEVCRSDWIKEVRLWTIVSWLFLTIGNLLGAMWAYVELGWGGFWAWDPVENAGILPWFTATAFLHSIILQEKRGMLKLWNNVLLILTFLLTIFGTFITRSGVIESVHSFSDVTIGLYFLIFLGAATLFSLYLIITRFRLLRGENEVESIFSREASFYINNLLFIFALVAVLWGTMLPLFSEWFIGRKVEVGPPFFNRVMAPIGIALLFLTGIGPEMTWRRAKEGLFKHEFMWPAILAGVVLVVTCIFGVRKWFPLAVSAGAAFVLVTILHESLHLSFWRAPRKYGGYLIHLGVVFIFIGIAGSAYQGEYSFDLKEGKEESIGGYELVLKSIDWVKGEDSEGVITTVSVAKGEKITGYLKPALFLHRNQAKPIAEVDLFIRPLKDIYLALGGISKSENVAEFKLIINPLISFVWLGGVVMIFGTLVAIFFGTRRRTL